LLHKRSRAVFEFLKPSFHPWTYLDNAALLADRRADLIDPAWAVTDTPS
jgi:hypothetical protein